VCNLEIRSGPQSLRRVVRRSVGLMRHARRTGALITLLWHAVAFSGEPSDYIRYAEDAKSSRLEVAIKTFLLPTGKTVDLIGVVHIADAAYYQELNRRFETYDAVLFELVGDPRALTEAAPITGGLSSVQQAAGTYLNLTFQLGAIDYRKPNMVHADATTEEFAKMQLERGENMVTLFARAMQAQMGGPVNSAAMQELDAFGLIRILMSDDSAAEFKKSLAKVFDQMEAMTAAMEGKDGTVVLGGRNALVVSSGEQGQGSARRQEATPDRRVLRRRAHARHRGGAGRRHAGEARARRVAGGMDDAKGTACRTPCAEMILTTPRADTNPARGTTMRAS
jgi:hypothetical protein